MNLIRTYPQALLGFLLTTSVLLSACSEPDPGELTEESTRAGESAHTEKVRERMRETVVHDVRVKVKYLTPESLARREAAGNEKDYDKLVESYSNGMSFVLALSPTMSDDDLMQKDVAGYDDYRNRVVAMNFDLKSHIRLETPDTVLFPVIGTLENSYGLSSERKLLVVFEGKPEEVLRGSEHFDIVFDDPVFGTGINRFSYRSSDVF